MNTPGTALATARCFRKKEKFWTVRRTVRCKIPFAQVLLSQSIYMLCGGGFFVYVPARKRGFRKAVYRSPTLRRCVHKRHGGFSEVKRARVIFSGGRPRHFGGCKFAWASPLRARHRFQSKPRFFRAKRKNRFSAVFSDAH